MSIWLRLYLRIRTRGVWEAGERRGYEQLNEGGWGGWLGDSSLFLRIFFHLERV